MKEENKKKFYELTDDERKVVIKAKWKKAKPIVKKVIFAIICVVAIFLMFISVFPFGR